MAKGIYYYDSIRALTSEVMAGHGQPIGAVVILKLYSKEYNSEVYHLEVVGSKVVGMFLDKADAEKCAQLYL